MTQWHKFVMKDEKVSTGEQEPTVADSGIYKDYDQIISDKEPVQLNTSGEQKSQIFSVCWKAILGIDF